MLGGHAVRGPIAPHRKTQCSGGSLEVQCKLAGERVLGKFDVSLGVLLDAGRRVLKYMARHF